VIVRQALGDDEASDVPIAAGSLVLIASWILHRHRRFWAAPERFDPSRFLPGSPQPARFAYMAFGAGPRTCVGPRSFLLATLLRRFRIELAGRLRVNPVGLVTVQPYNPPSFLQRSRWVAG
jgi:cytochrome P450